MNEQPQSSHHLRTALYEQLPLGNGETRVLILHPASSNEALVACSLDVMTILPEASCEYVALSYVWGDPHAVKSIEVNGYDFSVTENLASALQQLRQNAENLLTIAKGINQGDILERNQQVLLMKTIYSKADHVLGWLGSDYEGGSQALNDLHHLFAAVMRSPADFGWVDLVPELLVENGTFPADQAGVKQFRSNIRLENISLLLERPFWQRIWIVQEMVIPTKVKLCCGNTVIELPSIQMLHVIILVLSRGNLGGRPETLSLQVQSRLNSCMIPLNIYAQLRRQFHRLSEKKDPGWNGIAGFLNARAKLGRHLASDPRDHVYGILGFLDLGIIPDYSENQTPARVYLEAARLGLQTACPDILAFAGIRQDANGSVKSSVQGLPSWVPDWTLANSTSLRVLRFPESHACPPRDEVQMQVVEDGWLRGESVIFDVVSKIEQKTGWDFKEVDLFESSITDNAETWTYPSGISRFMALIILWVGGHDGTTSSPRDLQVDSKLFESYERIFMGYVLKRLMEKYSAQVVAQFIKATIGIERLKETGGNVQISNKELFLLRSRQLRRDLRCFHTEKGYVGFGPLATERSDRVCVIRGHKSPVLLRQEDSYYKFVGDCDVVGIMNGEVLDAVGRGEARFEEIEIR